MLLFGHIGITLGAAWALDTAILRDYFQKRAKKLGLAANPHTKALDYRLVIVGSLLPDIIDKLLGFIILPQVFSSGRIFAHTLLFSVVLLVGGLFLFFRYHRIWLLTLSGCFIMHLILDYMWLRPVELFWPLYGWHFDKADLPGWVPRMLQELRAAPTFVPEIIGILIVALFAYQVWRRKKIGSFLRYGRID